MTALVQMQRTHSTRHDQIALLTRIRGEFLEMPGLRLGPAQAARLWAMDRETSELALRSLVETGFLWRTPDGLYLRVTTS